MRLKTSQNKMSQCFELIITILGITTIGLVGVAAFKLERLQINEITKKSIEAKAWDLYLKETN